MNDSLYNIKIFFYDIKVIGKIVTIEFCLNFIFIVSYGILESLKVIVFWNYILFELGVMFNIVMRNIMSFFVRKDLKF